MLRSTVLAMLVICVGLVGSVYAQDTTQRTKELVAALDKSKYKKKDKANISIEMFVDIKNEAVVREPAEYAGIYETEGYRLDLQIEAGGIAAASGYDSFVDGRSHINFVLKDGRIDGALLTGTKVYASGESIPFEAVFVKRTSRAGTRPEETAAGRTAFGLGFIQHSHPVTECDPAKATRQADKNATLAEIADKKEGWTNRVFLEKK